MNYMYEKVKKALELVPDFRERKYRSHFLMIMALKELGLVQNGVKVKSGDKIELVVGNKDDIGAFGKIGIVYGSLERAWRQVLEKEVALRGFDYDQKDNLESEKLEELGYTAYTSQEADVVMDKF